MPLAKRRYIPPPPKKLHIKFTGINVVDVSTGEQVLMAKGEEAVGLISQAFGLSNEAIAVKE